MSGAREKGGDLNGEAESPERRERVGRESGVETIDFPRGSAVDAELVQAARAGDSSAFEGLVRRHLKAAHRVASSRLSQSQDADDVCQDAFLTALQRLDTCKRPEHFRAWLLTIVKNRAHNFREYQDVRRAQPLEHAVAKAARGDPERDVSTTRLRQRLNEALAELTELQRQVVLLHDYEGWKHKEVGERLGISPGASRFHLHVGRKRLRELLRDLNPGEGS
jgi:RNA polymerase sigma-70 factor (ECF subfamily)